MKLHNIDADVGEREIKRNVAEGQSEKEKKSRLKNFCSKLWDNTKRTTQVLAVAVGMTVMAYGCDGKVHPSGDVDIDNIEITDGVDVENDADVDGLEDVPDVEVETNCIGPSEPLEGEVDPLLANSKDDVAMLNSSDSEVSGDYELIVGGAVSGDLLILGECPDDPDSIAAFGAQDGTVEITPQYRLDFGQTIFVAELPDADGANCPPPEVDEDIVSMYNEEANLAVKKTTVGTVNTRGEFGFTTALDPSILVNGLEADSTIPLDGYGYDVKAIMVSVENSLLDMAANVYSNTGENILQREVSGNVDSADSKTLRVYQLGSGDSMLPNVEWNEPPNNPVTGTVIACLRSCNDPNEEIEKTIEIGATVTPVVIDACGSVFGGFDIDPATLGITVELFDPGELYPYHTFEASVVSGSFETMSEGSLLLNITVRRNPPPPFVDAGRRVTMQISVNGESVSIDTDPRTGEKERVLFSIGITFEDPNTRNYGTYCECLDPAGF